MLKILGHLIQSIDCNNQNLLLCQWTS